MESSVSVDPFRCRLWSMHHRLEEHITEENCKKEIVSFREHGQRALVLGRPVHDDPDYDVEIICGARRLFVARILKVNLSVELRGLSDQEAILAMHIEGLRKDISPYERGLAYLQWLRGGYFESQEHMARALNVSPSVVSRSLKLAQLPSVIVGAFGSAADIREGWGTKLTEILKDPARKESTFRAARAMATSSAKHSPREAYRKLLASAAPTAPGGRKVTLGLHDQVIEAEDGTPLFRIRHQQDSIALLLPLEVTSAKVLEAIQRALVHILGAPGVKKSAERGLPNNAHEPETLRTASM